MDPASAPRDGNQGEATAERVSMADTDSVASLRDDLLGGLCHSVNGRLAALHGILHVARLQKSQLAEIQPALEAELRHVELLVEHLRWLRTPSPGPLEPLVVQTVLREALALIEHRTLAVPVPALSAPRDLPPVRAHWNSLRQLFAVCAAAHDATVPIECSARDRVVQVSFVMPLDTAMELSAAAGSTGCEASADPSGLKLRLQALG